MGDKNEKYSRIGEGKLTAQGSSTFPQKAREIAKWQAGDRLIYLVNPENGDILVKNDSINPKLQPADIFFHKSLTECFSEKSSSVIIIKGDIDNDSLDPLMILKKYFLQHKGYLDFDDRKKGVFFIDQVTLQNIKNAEKAHNIQDGLSKTFDRFENIEEVPAIYILDGFQAHNHQIKERNTSYTEHVTQVLNELNNSQKVMFYMYRGGDPDGLVKRYHIKNYMFIDLASDDVTINKCNVEE